MPLRRGDQQGALGFAFGQVLLHRAELAAGFRELVGLARGKPGEFVAALGQLLPQRRAFALQALQGLALAEQLGLALLQLVHGDVALVHQPW